MRLACLGCSLARRGVCRAMRIHVGEYWVNRTENREQWENLCLQTSCTMDQNLARLQNPHRFLRENRFLEGEDPSKLADD